MTRQPRAFFALDLGSATTAGAVLGYVGGRWRLVAHAAAPSYVGPEALLSGLLARIELADAEMLVELAAGEPADIPTLVAEWPRLVARSAPVPRIAVLAGSRRQRRRLEEVALRAGWLAVGGSADEVDPVALSRLALSREIDAVLLGADHSPAGDDRRHLPDLVALVAAIARSRPELAVVLAGGAANYESSFATLSEPEFSLESARSSWALSVAGPETPQPERSSMEVASAEPPAATVESTETLTTDGDVNSEIPAATGGDRSDDGGEPRSASSASATEAALSVAVPTDLPAVASETPVPDTAGRTRAPRFLLAPSAESGEPAGSSLQQVLEGLRATADDSRVGVARSVASLAQVLGRPIEVVEIGLQGGLRARSEPLARDPSKVASLHACRADASFAPPSPSEEVIDDLLEWSTLTLDRHRAMDRLNDLRLSPWGEADGEGAVFRLAAAKGALARLVAATPEMTASPMPELLIAAGGIFSALPPTAVALAMADLMRRPGVTHLACDGARLLGPLGAIEDDGERSRMIASLADDILMPLGGLILPSGIRGGRSAGHLRLKSAPSPIELHPGTVQIVDLPPGRSAKVDLDFRDPVRLGTRSRHFIVDVSGGLGGLLVDLRDIPMRISDRPDSRRSALVAWQRDLWPELAE